jgi:indolepyruvate ferredoxin oxidoreductase, beta subunit
MTGEYNILIAGVGGQGVILISELLGRAAVIDGLPVRGSEILGMAVRGGSVVSLIRLGPDCFGPLIPEGKGDLMISMEPAEALRNAGYMSDHSLAVVNTQRVIPVGVSLGQGKYQDLDVILAKVASRGCRMVQMDAQKLAAGAGSELSANVVMLGAAFGAGNIPIKLETIKAAIQERFSPKLAPVNIKAFTLGFELGENAKR